MYLRPDEVARVLEKVGFSLVAVTNESYGYHRGEHFIYINRLARLGRTALVIHPGLKQRSLNYAEPTGEIKICNHFQQYPSMLDEGSYVHYGIPHGFSSRMALERFISGVFGQPGASSETPAPSSSSE